MMPSASEQQKKLNQLFSGTWRGDETLYPSDWDPKGGPAFGTWIVRAAVDGFAVLVDYDEERDGKILYRGHGVHAWDEKENTFFCYWFDNIGVVPAHGIRATLDGNHYTYASKDPGGHMRMTYEFAGDKLEFRIDRSKDGTTWNPMHVGRYTRVQ